jgi:DNA invertase Pin-like site-specific DNA recombinase
MIFSDSSSMRIAAYLRVSTDQQSHDSQRLEMEDYCRRRGWADVRWYTDTASGANQGREGLAALMDQVRRGKMDAVVTFKLDRLARSLCHLAQLIAEFQAHRVALVCPSQGIDTSNANPAAMLQINVLAAVAQFEREIITERVNAGIAAARHRGVRLGRPSKAHRHAGAVAAMAVEGFAAAEIARKLGMPYSTASEMVREFRGSLPASLPSQISLTSPALLFSQPREL